MIARAICAVDYLAAINGWLADGVGTALQSDINLRNAIDLDLLSRTDEATGSLNTEAGADRNGVGEEEDRLCEHSPRDSLI